MLNSNIFKSTFDDYPTIGGNSDTLTASISDAGITYQWQQCETGIIIPGATNQSFVPTQSGNYAVVITDEQGCSGI